MFDKYKLLFFSLIAVFANAEVSIYGQCGGESYTGETNCAPGLACVFHNIYYWQCLSGVNLPTSQAITTKPQYPVSTNGYFTSKNGKLYDANGKEFLIRGVNSAHLWYDNHNRNYAYKSLFPISQTNANLVRIVWGLNPNGMDENQLKKIIERTIELKMIPMIEIHDATGSSDVNKLIECALWFKNNINLFNEYKKYILINIANEWSPWSTPLENWRDAYSQAINIVRSSGWGGSLIVDASAYAQNPDGPIKYGNYLVENDPLKNIVFSIHMYSQWKTVNPDYKISEKLAELQSKGLTVIIGEFASTHPEGCHWITIDAHEILRECKTKGIGFIGWSWLGNGKGDCDSDLTPLDIIKGDSSLESTWGSNTYSDWGEILINYSGYGIRDTSIKASYF